MSIASTGQEVVVGADETLLTALRRVERRGALLMPAGLLRHLPDAGGGRRRRPPRHVADRTGARRRHDAGLHLAGGERGATHSRFVARLYYSAMPLAAGQTFAGYTIVRLLGSGGMGEVYLAEHPRLPRRDALKVLPTDVCADNEYRQRFNREADIAATLWHPHIVGVHDRGDVDGQIWISMDYVDGTDAGELLRDRYPNGMPKEEVARHRHLRRRGARLCAPAGPAAPRRQARQHHADRSGSG